MAFRTALRRFEQWSLRQFAKAGVTVQQDYLMVAVCAHPAGGPSIRELAEQLVLRHHTVVELVDRAEGAGLVRRCHDASDRRVVRIQLTEAGRSLVDRLEATHRDQLEQITPAMAMIYKSLDEPMR